MTYNPDRLTRLGHKRQHLRAELETLRPDLAEEIRAAHAGGMAQIDIVRLTGYTRDQVRQICLPPDLRRTRGKTRASA